MSTQSQLSTIQLKYEREKTRRKTFQFGGMTKYHIAGKLGRLKV